ncbi:hypothetical protein BH23GEM9_BH23GEM9_33950 [soil metagenome]
MKSPVPFRIVACAALCACQPSAEQTAGDTVPGTSDGMRTEQVQRADVERALDAGLEDIGRLADSVDVLFRPVPLQTPGQEAAFRRFGNVQQLERARSLGVHAAGEAERQAALRDGGLIVLEDSTALWVVRELTHSEPLVTPDARALLVEIGERFHQRLERLGSPPFRLEVTSVLRTAESQAELRRTNPNAALGQSTHEYGTTLDVAYASFAAPAQLELEPAQLPWLQPRLEVIGAALMETVAARNSRELQAILGHVMSELQAEGLAMVTLERQQPVYHFTVARRIEAP